MVLIFLIPAVDHEPLQDLSKNPNPVLWEGVQGYVFLGSAPKYLETVSKVHCWRPV